MKLKVIKAIQFLSTNYEKVVLAHYETLTFLKAWTKKSGALRKNEFKYFVAMLVIMYMATIHLNSFLRKAPEIKDGFWPTAPGSDP